MKRLEFYFVLFGIGIGAFLSGVVISAFPVPKVEYTDEEIRERARELGMIGLRESIESNLDSSDDESREKDKIEEDGSRGEAAEIAINRGDGSAAVARKLYDADIIEDSSAFEEFISSEGAGNSLREGTYSIEKGSDFESILSIITKGAF